MKPRPAKDLWARMDDLAAQGAFIKRYEPRSGDFTLEDWMERFKVPETTSRNQINGLMRKGLVEVAGKNLMGRKFYRLKDQ